MSMYKKGAWLCMTKIGAMCSTVSTISLYSYSSRQVGSAHAHRESQQKKHGKSDQPKGTKTKRRPASQEEARLC